MCVKTFPKRNSRKRQKSMNKYSVNLAWKSYLQKGTPKCENRIPFNVLSLFPRFPGTPKKAPKLDPELTLKPQNVRKLRTQKNNKKTTPKKSSKGPKLCPNWMAVLWPKRSENHTKFKNHKNGA